MTRSLHLFLCIFGFALSSCTSGKVDVRNPTVEQMDQLDVQWGLPKRQPKGGAKRLMPTPAAVDGAVPAAPVALDPLATGAPQP